jgi:hypothetical protein
VTDFLVRLLQKGAQDAVAIRPRLAARFERGGPASPVRPGAHEAAAADDEVRPPVDGIGRLRVVEHESSALDESNGARSQPRSASDRLDLREPLVSASVRGPRASRADFEATVPPVVREPDPDRRIRRGTDVTSSGSSTPSGSPRSSRAAGRDDRPEADMAAREVGWPRTARRPRSVVPDERVPGDPPDRGSLVALAGRARSGERPSAWTEDGGRPAYAIEARTPSRAEGRQAVEPTPADRLAAAIHVSEPTLRPPAVGRGIAPSVDSVRTPAQTRGLPAEGADSGPTVHVTIGRIEVRAPSAPQPRRARKRAPQLSLEEYLRRRSEAAR